MEVGMHEAKTNLSKLVEFAQNGEEVLITNRGQVVARIVAEIRGSNKAKELMDKMRAMHKESPLGTLEELMEFKAEGRR